MGGRVGEDTDVDKEGDTVEDIEEDIEVVVIVGDTGV